MFNTGYRRLGAGARGWSWEMIWGGRWEGGSELGTHVHPWLIHVNVWQNQYSIVKQNKVKIKIKKKRNCSVQFSQSVMSDSLQPYGLQHSRLPCPSPTPGACSNSCPSSQWCHPTISSSVVPLFSCCQSFPASGSFPVSWLLASGGWSTKVSVSASVLPMNIQP